MTAVHLPDGFGTQLVSRVLQVVSGDGNRIVAQDFLDNFEFTADLFNFKLGLILSLLSVFNVSFFLIVLVEVDHLGEYVVVPED